MTSSNRKIVYAVAKLFAKYPEVRFLRKHVLAILAVQGIYANLSRLTYLWPDIQQVTLKEHGLYTFRPEHLWQYTVGATVDPTYPSIDENRRERYVLTVILNQLRGGNLTQLAGAGHIPNVSRLSRYKSYTGGINESELANELHSLISQLKMLPMASPNARLTIP
jgi:hypothetical protein